jgi:DNA polymerase-3 subunit delta
MASLRLEAAYRALKRGEPAPVYYLTGEADVLKDELAADIVRAAVDQAGRDFNVDARSAGDLDGEALHALVETPPMLASRRAVVVKNLEQWRANAAVWKVLLKYLERPSPSTVLVLVHGAGEKPNDAIAARAEHVEVDSLTPDLLRRWVAARALKAGISLEPDASEHLITAVGNDLGALATEIEKLAAAAPTGEPVTLALVSQLAGVRRGETLGDWVEAVLRHDTVGATALLEVVLPQPGVNGVRMVTALGTALLGTRLARALADAGTPPRDISSRVFGYLRQTRPQGVGLWSDEAKRWTRAAGSWSGGDLDSAIAETYEADRSLKSSTLTDERGVLAGLLLRIGPGRAGKPAGVAA